MKIALTLTIVLLVAAFGLAALFGKSDPNTIPTIQESPWQIEPLNDGRSRVFGLILGNSKIQEALNRFGAHEQPFIIASPGETGNLEIYFSSITAGTITGKLIVTGEVATADLAAMRSRSPKTEYMQSSTKKSSLTEPDRIQALTMPIRSIAFIPSANLEEATVIERFGQPTQRIRTSPDTEHFLYPERGLDLVLDTKGKELLQYVPPAQFEKLRQPLLTQPTP